MVRKKVKGFFRRYPDAQTAFNADPEKMVNYLAPLADAYAIFCAGKAKEVMPADHKLVDYWKYVCFELPMIQQSKNIQEAEVTEKHAVPEVEELPVCC
ncbi:hypothetical protein GUJ93_ZPchr0015g6738 [Zizania palustris]|uniref:Uncharacterized protein n=1 Tax=Zizania palustris TaxID=103762 RepID=A0A8J5TDF7_ZIZPA|nr:hypothetical protein GUJ93_ZPchr0015g6738 [Zizania palustris]